MKKKQQDSCDTPYHASLVNSRRRGTLIIGEFRTGTHFLAELCEHQAEKSGLSVQSWYELTDPKQSFDSHLALELPGYQIVIINLPDHKHEIIQNPHMINDWVVIRLVPQDRLRWFVSWFFFCFHGLQGPKSKQIQPCPARLDGHMAWYVGDQDDGHYYSYDSRVYLCSWSRARGSYADNNRRDTVLNLSDDPTYHHNTRREVYDKFLAQTSWKQPGFKFWVSLNWALINHTLGAMIPADHVYAYEDLESLANEQVRWKPNEYPKRDFLSEMESGWLINELLNRFRSPIVGKRKSR